MEKKDKFNLAEVLGVEEDERWTYPTVFGLFRVHNGVREHYTDDNKWIPSDDEVGLVKMLNHPESIIRSLPLTEQELELCRVFEAKYLTRNANSRFISMWDARPSENEGGMGKYYTIDNCEAWEIASIDAKFFPSIEPGDCICVEEERYADYIEEDEAEERRP